MAAEGFFCRTCGKQHPELPMDFHADAPVQYYAIPEHERAARCQLSPELCAVDKQHFYIHGCLELPVIDGPRPFVWGVWVSLSKSNFKRAMQLWDVDSRESEPPYFGWLSTSLPLYSETLNLATNVHTRAVGLRPLIELEPTDHPLAVEQREGITMERVRQIAEATSHPPH